MYDRVLKAKLLQLGASFPVLAVTGPRQSGKTTLCKMAFPDYGYVNLEDIVVRQQIMADTHSFLNQFPQGVIIDEAHNYPDLFSYVQVIVDKDKSRRFVLTGSSNFLIMQKLSQTLAGRVAVMRLLPLALRELGDLGDLTTDEILLRGFYPAVWGDGRPATDVYRSYFATYVQRDVMQLLNIKDMMAFQRFVSLCAARVGSEFVAQDLSNEVGVSLPTIQSWLSVLEASYVVFRLPPYYKNVGKRLTKTPKIYFHDVGLVCFLLGIRTVDHLKDHPLRGAIFENMIVCDMLKNRYNIGEDSNLFFYRDKSNREVDILQEEGMRVRAYEVKSAKRYNPEFFKNMNYLRDVLGDENVLSSKVIYDGDEDMPVDRNGIVNYRMELVRDAAQGLV